MPVKTSYPHRGREGEREGVVGGWVAMVRFEDPLSHPQSPFVAARPTHLVHPSPQPTHPPTFHCRSIYKFKSTYTPPLSKIKKSLLPRLFPPRTRPPLPPLPRLTPPQEVPFSIIAISSHHPLLLLLPLLAINYNNYNSSSTVHINHNRKVAVLLLLDLEIWQCP